MRFRVPHLLLAFLLLLPLPALAAPKLTRPPSVVTFVQAKWPDDAPVDKKQVTVTLRLDIDAEGRVQKAEVTESAGPAFDKAAVDALLRFVWKPALWDDQPGPVRISYRYVFTMEEKASPAVLEGQVRDAETGKPVPNLPIRAVELPGVATQTRADGKFRLDNLPAGKFKVDVGAPPYATVRVEELLGAGKRLQVRYVVARQDAKPKKGGDDDDDIVVHAVPLRRQTVSVTVEAAEATRVPGGQGDVLKVVESMPGVARASAGSGDVVVWGSSPGESQTFIDGVPVPRLYHEGGLRSVLHSDLVRAVEVLPGGYGAEWGRGLGAVVSVETKRHVDLPDAYNADRHLQWHGQANVDPIEASARASVPVGPTLLTASGRYSWLDKTLGTAVGTEAQQFFPLPRYNDAQVRWELPTKNGTRTDLTWLHGYDALDRVQNPNDVTLRSTEARESGFERVILRWQRDSADGSRVSVTPWWGMDSRTQRWDVGSQTADTSEKSWSGGLRAEWRAALASWVGLRTGLDVQVRSMEATRQGSAAVPPREGDIRAWGQPLPEQVGTDRWQVTQMGVAPWISANFHAWGERLALEPGLRLDPLVETVSRKTPKVGNTPEIGLLTQDWSAEPRIQARARPLSWLGIRASWAKVAQPAAAADLSAVFGNPQLVGARGQHYVAALEVGLPFGVTLEVAAFHLESEGLAVRSAAEQPLLAQSLVATGEGRTNGAQLTAKYQDDAWFGWIAWTVSQAERRSAADAAWRLSDYDQTHLLTAALAWKPGAGFDLGLRVRVATGAPRTPVVGAWFDALRGQWQPLFGAHNAERLPMFASVDASVKKRWTWESAWLEAYLEVQNASNRANIEEFLYNRNYSERGGLRGLPVLPMLGVRCGW